MKDGEYKFYDQDWFEMHIPVWEEHLKDLFSRDIRALEIGSYEGRCSVWLLERMTRGSVLVCVDTWDGKDPTLDVSHPKTIDAEKVFDHNILTFISKGDGSRLYKIYKEKKSSIEFLAEKIHRQCKPYDLIYVDGNHEGLCTLTDLVMSWQVLSVGGYLVFDDYRWIPDPDMKVRVTPHDAWDAFAAMKPEGMELVHQHRQCIVRKV